MFRKTIKFTVILTAVTLFSCLEESITGIDDDKPEITTKVTDSDGNTYTTVTIGTQVWTVENLRTKKYNDGTSIQHVPDSAEWLKLNLFSTPAYCFWNNTKNKDSIAKFGALYNWYAVNTGKLAPKGWRVPTADDWKILEEYLIANGYNWDETKTGNKIAKALAAKSDWITNSITQGDIGYQYGESLADNNRSGFNAMPAGFRASGSIFYSIGSVCGWWSSTETSDDYAACRLLGNRGQGLGIDHEYKPYGYSVRLVKDVKSK